MRKHRIGIVWAAVLLSLLLAGPALAGWSQLGTNQNFDLEAVWGWDAGDIAMVGHKGTATGKALTFKPWTNISTGLDTPVRGVWGAANDDIWAVGDDISHWNGSAWSLIDTPDAPLNAVWGRATDDIYAVGDAGLVLHYDGSDWTAEGFVATGENLYDVFGNDTCVKAVGAGGTVLTHTYGITGWSNENFTGKTNDLYGVWVDNAGGWAVGAGGRVLEYDGSAWANKALAEDSLYDVFGLEGEAWAVGAGGLIRHYDGSWATEDSGTTEDLFGVWAITTDNGPVAWACGDQRTRLRYTTEAVANPPYRPCCPRPSDGKTGVGITPTLKWKGGHPDAATENITVNYTVYLDGKVVGRLSEDHDSAEKVRLSMDVPAKYALRPGTLHTWQVKAKDENKLVRRSKVWGFTTGSYAWAESYAPALATPGYPVTIYGEGFGTEKPDVKIGSRLVGLDGYGSVLSAISGTDGEGKPIYEYMDNQIRFRVPSAIYWTTLPATVKVYVKPAGSTQWSNGIKMTVYK